jgi:hypothetical protein
MKTGTKKITSSVVQDFKYYDKTVTQDKIIPSKETTDVFTDLESITTTKGIRSNLFNIIKTDALNHPKTI